MGRKKKEPSGKVVPSIAGLNGMEKGSRISISDVLRRGTNKEVRFELGLIAMSIEAGRPLESPEKEFLSTALRKIADGGKADEAFGLGRKRMSPQAAKNYEFLVTTLREQGMSAEAAWETVARLDFVRGELRREGGGEALRKKVERASK